jgi:hypothetical protein
MKDWLARMDRVKFGMLTAARSKPFAEATLAPTPTWRRVELTRQHVLEPPALMLQTSTPVVTRKVSALNTPAQQGCSKVLMPELVPQPVALMMSVAGFLRSALVTVSVPLVR